ncbi:hypothetical protein PSN45_004324 [Yamadazyma tenuis]|uniref:UspA domain-containing protein n=1 Tax=Candida tenuis (strain ATCC 10573 / BCRC 21748 / CBS 615 / JCM 9827 / NBRC 10315 / NRRL Y-1498 / VKM Y-70) TaxID=590646 RepID=G3B667_CANTC|nr:uncharacterized protein CANTEDRAFT_94152 [Yamadazyma tenuis ATCC 10573]EGV63396.1 hypothetical protein CANTEDRAFT_94152 [Yamadazyma tenuis ATCC 10573]WEJ96781.1 hypothetical protein PSN45_004324 [Yamadazyma tenuis]
MSLAHEAGSKTSIKPSLLHAGSAPDLVSDQRRASDDSRATKSEGSHAAADDEDSSDSDVDLLDYLQKVDYTYRSIKLRVGDKETHISAARQNYEKRVSFDTVNLKFEADSSENELDDWGFETAGHEADLERGRRMSRASPSSSPLQSPSTSPTRRVVSPALDISNGLQLTRFLSNYAGPSYPTTPIITHNGCTFTKMHRQFDDLVVGKLNNKQHNFLKPILPNRVILVYISARKHTWVALDWVLSKFIENGDSVIIVSAIDSPSLTKKRKFSNFSGKETAMTKRMRLRQRNRPEFVKVIAKHIMSYAMEVINPDVIAKVSIELAVGKPKKVLQEMYKLYEPNIVATGTKPSTRIGAPLRSWASSKITDRLVKNYPLPVIITPAIHMGPFEKSLEKQINMRYNDVGQDVIQETDEGTDDVLLLSKQSGLDKDEDEDEDEDEEDRASFSSISSEESYSSFTEITKAYARHKKLVRTKMQELESNRYQGSYFSDTLGVLSDSSATFCREVNSIDPDFRGRGAKLARLLTGSTRFGVSPFKTKSLLAPLEKVKTDASSSSYVPKVSYKDLKRRLKEKEMIARQEQNTPTINVISPPKSPKQSATSSGISSPPKQTLKFVNLETPKKSTKSSRLKDFSTIQKSFSHDGDEGSRDTRPCLEPLKSHPDLHTMYDTSSGNQPTEAKEPKKRSKRFWKLFSSG